MRFFLLPFDVASRHKGVAVACLYAAYRSYFGHLRSPVQAFLFGQKSQVQASTSDDISFMEKTIFSQENEDVINYQMV